MNKGTTIAFCLLHVAHPLQLPYVPKHVTVVTTASLPWMTGTAVNPLLRTVELARRGANVTLMLPFVDPKELVEDPCAHIYPGEAIGCSNSPPNAKLAQEELYGGLVFQTPAEQEVWIRDWLRQTRVKQISDDCESASQGYWNLHWYPGRYCPAIGSIILGGPSQIPNQLARLIGGQRATDAVKGGDVLAHLPSIKEVPRELLILEEPEHLNWYHTGRRWPDAGYSMICGVVHTDYMQYSRSESLLGGAAEAVTWATQNLAYRAHCDVLIPLSEAVGKESGAPPAISVVENVHGVRQDFLDIGHQVIQRSTHNNNEGQVTQFDALHRLKIYFLAKKLWTKGYSEMLALVEYCNKMCHDGGSEVFLPRVMLHMYGSGTNDESISAAFEEQQQRQLQQCNGNRDCLNILTEINGAVDHVILGGERDNNEDTENIPMIFVNPSRSEVLCTATAEALAMGKIVLIARHPSNEFFYQFQNCRTFGSPEEFRVELAHAIEAAYEQKKKPSTNCWDHNGTAITAKVNTLKSDMKKLSWEAATDRLLSVIHSQSHQFSKKGNARTSKRPTSMRTSRIAHRINRLFRAGAIGDVMSYDMYMVLERRNAVRKEKEGAQ